MVTDGNRSLPVRSALVIVARCRHNEEPIEPARKLALALLGRWTDRTFDGLDAEQGTHQTTAALQTPALEGAADEASGLGRWLCTRWSRSSPKLILYAKGIANKIVAPEIQAHSLREGKR